MHMTKEIKTHPEALGIVAVVLMYIGWCFFTISYHSVAYIIVGSLVMAFSGILYIGLCYIINESFIVRQFKIINDGIWGISLILLFTLFRQNTVNEKIIVAATSVIWILTATAGAYIINKKSSILSSLKTCNIKRFVYTHIYMCIFLLIIIFLSFDGSMYQFKWDGKLYNVTCQNLNMTSISNLAIYGHIAQTYGVLVKITSLLTGDVEWAMILNNIGLLIFSIYFVYKILKCIVPGKKEYLYIMCTSVYAFSPFLLGMVNYHSLDYYLICLLPAVVYFTLTQNWILHFVSALFFCFTKEPAIVIYAMLCMGILINDIWELNEKKSFQIRLICIRKKYYLMVLVGLIWLITYKLLGPWSAGNGGFELDIEYVIEKIKVLYILNFNWLFLGANVFIFIWMCVKKEIKKERYWLIPIICISIGFVFFSITFATVNHARYIDSNVLILYLPALVCLVKLSDKMVVRVLLASLSFIMLIASYKTFDPISKKVFKVVNVGNEELISTSESLFGDAMIYNKQMLYMESVITEGFDVAVKNNFCVGIPVVDESTYNFDGILSVQSIKKGYIKEIQYFDGSKHFRADINSDNMQAVEVYSLGEDSVEMIGTALDKPMMYLYMDGIGDELAKEIGLTYAVMDEYAFEKNGWLLRAIVFEV